MIDRYVIMFHVYDLVTFIHCVRYAHTCMYTQKYMAKIVRVFCIERYIGNDIIRTLFKEQYTL